MAGKVGCPPIPYNSDTYPILAEQCAREGLTNLEIAARFGIGKATFYNWRKKHEAFREALKEGKEVVDAKVERALLTRALGLEYTEKKIVKDETGAVVREEETGKLVLPDVTACRLWLLNRRPEQWRDTQRIEHTGKDGGPIRIITAEDLTDDELAAIAAGNSAGSSE